MSTRAVLVLVALAPADPTESVIRVRVYCPLVYPSPVPRSPYSVNVPLDPANTRRVKGPEPVGDDPVGGDCWAMIPPARTNTGIRLRGTDRVVAIGPVKVAPVK